ncbi:MAG TPA: TetR/AcrR family transcriptional regulator [Nocardiopsis listeri]|uniref:TetR/AcrR family transcriptional regulator n=1 Tax=Nocardiopsis listeri TaxID=53440 RepID=UPI001DD4539C|nr:TetR/AcrR family transcriptional regulator [Nocardiopsis listeri]HJE60427.1 TetR/AcrR family transcriptional regulator [Nocardiopsis listeri]
MSTKRVEQLHAQGLRTRASLLEVAREAFEESRDVSLNSIAKRAGVGIGTLYRHFPTREDLVFELYRDQVQRLTRASAELLDEHSPQEAFRLWLERFARYAMTKAGLLEVLRTATAHGRFAQVGRGPVADAVEHLLVANQEAGTLRADLTADDVLLAVAGLYQLDPSADDWERRAHRLLDLVLCGLRPRD